MEDKLIELETRYSFQEELLEKLNQIVAEQQKQLDIQSQQLQLLHAQLSELRDNLQLDDSEPGQEKPPHY